MSAHQETPRATAVSRVVARLRTEILAGVRGPGEPVREEKVAEEYQVSRHTVRNAFAQLAALRLLASEPYRGVRVTEFDYPQAADVQMLRSALESEAVRTLQRRYGTHRWPAEALAPARELLAQMRGAADHAVAQDLHARLHLAVVGAAGSERFCETYRELDAEVRLLVARGPHSFPVERLLADHRRYLADLPVRGADVVHEHMLASLDVLYPDHARRAGS